MRTGVFSLSIRRGGECRLRLAVRAELGGGLRFGRLDLERERRAKGHEGSNALLRFRPEIQEAGADAYGALFIGHDRRHTGFQANRLSEDVQVEHQRHPDGDVRSRLDEDSAEQMSLVCPA